MHKTFFQKSKSSFENRVSPDQLGLMKSADQDPHCFSSTPRLNMNNEIDLKIQSPCSITIHRVPSVRLYEHVIL